MSIRRSICITEPKVILAGQTQNMRFTYIPANNLPAKTLLKFDINTKGREVDWQLPHTNVKKKANAIWLELSSGKKILATSIEDHFGIPSQFEFALPEEIKSGEEVAIYMGAPSKEEGLKYGSRSQLFIQRRRPFHLYIDPKGKGDYKEPEVFQIDVKGNKLHHIKIITPSIIGKNERFDVIVRFEDAYGNLTGYYNEETMIELTYDQLRDNLSWKLFIPETGFINLPNQYFNEPGVYRFKLTNCATKETFYSAPIKCFTETKMYAFWGLLHGESERYDALENVESALRNFRDDKALQFYSVSPFESEEEVTNDEWKNIVSNVAEFNETDRFITMLGFQWNGKAKEEGLRQLIFSKDNKQIMRLKDSKSNNLKKIYKGHTPKDFISIPSFTMNKDTCFDFSEFSPEYERVVEIYNSWGCSECLEKEGNLRPIQTEKGKSLEAKEGSIRTALNKGHRFGFVAGGLDDRGIYQDFYESDRKQYSPGLTVILGETQSREGFYQALYHRKCYATTGERMLIWFTIAEKSMGSELSTSSKPGLLYNRHIQIFAAGTDSLKEITLIRNGEIFKTFSTDDYHFETSLDDSELLSNIALKDQEDRSFSYYYLRTVQNDGHMAWSSPIWVSISQEEAPKKGRKKTL